MKNDEYNRAEKEINILKDNKAKCKEAQRNLKERIDQLREENERKDKLIEQVTASINRIALISDNAYKPTQSQDLSIISLT